MSALDEILDVNVIWDAEGNAYFKRDDAKQQIKDLMLELIEDTDPSADTIARPRGGSKYCGNILRQKVQEL